MLKTNHWPVARPISSLSLEAAMEVTMTVKKRPTTQRRPGASSHTGGTARTVVENINHPGKSRAVDARKYQAMRRALLKVLPSRTPGLTLADTLTAVLPHLPAALFPGGAHAGWWLKTVQLDLEATAGDRPRKDAAAAPTPFVTVEIGREQSRSFGREGQRHPVTREFWFD